MSVRERIAASDWTREAFIMVTILAYVLSYVVGLNFNRRKVGNWVGAHRDVLTSQFYQVGSEANSVEKAGSENIKLTVDDGPTTYSLYATGRENAATFLARMQVLGRQNIIALVVEYVSGFFFASVAPKETVEITIRPWRAADIPPFVFAIVNKGNMRESRDEYYYLSLTKTTDSPKLPPQFTFMTESAEVSDTLYTSKLAEALKGSEGILKYIAITDQRDASPKTMEELAPEQRIVLSLNFPKSKDEEEASARLVDAAIGLTDVLASLKPWRPEVAKKIKATREAAQKRVQKVLDERKAEAVAEKKAAAKRQAADNVPKLSAAEQKKIEQRQREKDARKQRAKQSRRM
jgi:hypothetical protein